MLGSAGDSSGDDNSEGEGGSGDDAAEYDACDIGDGAAAAVAGCPVEGTYV